MQITEEFQYHYFVLILIIIDAFHHASVMTLIPSERFYKNNWLKIHQDHCFQVNQENINSTIIGDSIVAGLTQYTNVCNNLFGSRFANLRLSGDRVENIFGA